MRQTRRRTQAGLTPGKDDNEVWHHFCRSRLKVSMGVQYEARTTNHAARAANDRPTDSEPRDGEPVPYGVCSEYGGQIARATGSEL